MDEKIFTEYAIDKDSWWYRWSTKWMKYIALKKEYWPTKHKKEKFNYGREVD